MMLLSGGWTDYCTLRLGYFSIKTYISITLWRVFLLSNTNTNKNLKTDASDWNIPISKLKRKRKKRKRKKEEEKRRRKKEEKKNKMLSSGGRSDYCTLRLGPPSSSALHSTVALSIYWWWNVNNLQWRERNIQIRT